MSAGEKHARESLRESVQENREQMELTEESRVLLVGLLRNEMRAAVADGIADALSPENTERFWLKGFEVAQKESKKRLREAAGDLVLGGLRGFLKWAAMAFVLVAFAYYVGGFAVAKAVWAAITKG